MLFLLNLFLFFFLTSISRIYSTIINQTPDRYGIILIFKDYGEMRSLFKFINKKIEITGYEMISDNEIKLMFNEPIYEWEFNRLVQELTEKCIRYRRRNTI